MRSSESNSRAEIVVALLASQKVCLLFFCLLFKTDEHDQYGSFGSMGGFRSWRKLNPRLYEHERSLRHIEEHLFSKKSWNSDCVRIRLLMQDYKHIWKQKDCVGKMYSIGFCIR